MVRRIRFLLNKRRKCVGIGVDELFKEWFRSRGGGIVMCIIDSEILHEVAKLLLSIFVAGFIGWEREQHDKAAGLKTHILICMGACLFMMVGMKLAPGAEFTRVIQGIVTGVGFVGAGAIIREGGNVRGVTTAAGIWVIAAIGLAIGLGEYFLAIFAAMLNYLILHYFGMFKPHAKKRRTTTVRESEKK